MKKKLAAAIIVFGLAAGMASANMLTFRMGYFVPRLTGDFWDIEFQNMTFKKGSFQDASLGICFELFLTRDFSLVAGLDVFRKNKAALYKDYLGITLEDGGWALPNVYVNPLYGYEIKHSITYASAPVQLSVKWTPLGRKGNIIPYIGGGAHAVIWNIRMQGEFVDFGDEYVVNGSIPAYPIYSVYAEESDGIGRLTFGWQVFGGVMIPVGTRMTVDVGAQYFSSKTEFKSAFEGFEPIDVGGFHISLGINYWF